MRYLTLDEIIVLHQLVISKSGGSSGIRDLGALKSAIAQPAMTFDGADLYPSLALKASALAYSLIQNHPFIDGNKRIGHAAMEVFLVMNGFQIVSDIDDQEQVIMGVAGSSLS